VKLDDFRNSDSAAEQLATLLRELENELSHEQYIQLKNAIRKEVPQFLRPVLAARLRTLGVEF
jgi:hypothetical protein